MMPTPDELILAVLSARPQHGYQLLELFRDPEQLGHIWDMSAAQVYAVLKRLEHNGEILGLVIEAEDAPARVEFRTTRRGRARMMAWLNESDPPASIRRVRVDFLSRMYAAAAISSPTEAIVSRQYAACEAERGRIAAQFDLTAAKPARLALSLQLAQYDAILTWMKQTFNLYTVSK
ncbi:MAG: helix-turn-helix transcriptional regulator [Chloroflexi bacterium]|nr:helix-turn-helix transcriptional regulator [Chloroflexota bacterium]